PARDARQETVAPAQVWTYEAVSELRLQTREESVDFRWRWVALPVDGKGGRLVEQHPVRLAEPPAGTQTISGERSRVRQPLLHHVAVRANFGPTCGCHS